MTSEKIVGGKTPFFDEKRAESGFRKVIVFDCGFFSAVFDEPARASIASSLLLLDGALQQMLAPASKCLFQPECPFPFKSDEV